MGAIKQYKCPKCSYETPRLYIGSGFAMSYGVYTCKESQTVESILISDGREWINSVEISYSPLSCTVDFTPKCSVCGNKDLEEWDEKHCPRCGEEMVWDGKFLCGDWD